MTKILITTRAFPWRKDRSLYTMCLLIRLPTEDDNYYWVFEMTKIHG